MVYRIKLEQFEGPLDLLLQLTQEQKVDITRLSLADVADQYLEYISKRETITLENLADFLSVAAKLILLKSKALLPLLQFTEEEEEEIKDLEQQLAQYKKFKDIALEIAKLADDPKVCFSRESFLGIQTVFHPPQNIEVSDLEKAFKKVIGDIPSSEKLEEEMVREVLTLEEKIVHLQDFLRERVQVSFQELVKDARDKVEIVVSFLALLELVKQKIVHVEQKELFSEISMKNKKQ